MGTESPQRISLLDSLAGEWAKLSLSVMRDVGAASQTLAGLMKIANRETFAGVEKIATSARVPLKTARKHLIALSEWGWIVHRGRQRLRSGRLRRTVTIAIPTKTQKAIEPYGVLPWWTCSGRLCWGSKAVLSVIMARLMGLKKAIEDQDGKGLDADDMVSSIEELGGSDRFQFPLDKLETETGLSRKTIITAKHSLHNAGVIVWTAGGSGEYGQTLCDTLSPNWEFHVIVTPADLGRVYVRFEDGQV